MAGFHHVELWVTEVGEDWQWLLSALGFSLEASWTGGQSWEAGGAYLTLTTSPNLSHGEHDRRRAGMNHLAFKGGSSSAVDRLMGEASRHGWEPLYQERYPFAGGEAHYAGWLENSAGYKVEIVAE